MFEGIDAFRARTQYVTDRLPEKGFAAAPSCAAKVSDTGRMIPFYGNTTIFDLDPVDIEWLTALQIALYDACGDVLAERLRPQTFHITLHDLMNGSDWQAIEADVQRTNAQAKAIVNGICMDFPWGVHVRARAVMSMVRTSVVLVFEPEDDANCRALMEMRARLQGVVNLTYPLTPHVTLAYFRPGKIDAEAIARLQSFIDDTQVAGRIMHLDVGRLNACVFSDMNHYAPLGEDAFDLERFVRAQAGCYDEALAEIRAGHKFGHWMWAVFPQIKGLGQSFESEYYGIASLAEARAYFDHPFLGPRLVQITHALETLETNNPTAIMGYPDDVKLRSCMTLFELAGGSSVFSAVLEKYFGGVRDERTLLMLEEE